MIKKINIKAYYNQRINNNKVALKSLTLLGNNESIKKQIFLIKKENQELKKEFKQTKKQIYRDSKVSENKAKEICKEFGKEFKSNKHIYDKDTYLRMKNEYQNLKIKTQAISAIKYRDIYGSSNGRTSQERRKKYLQISVIIGLLILFMVPFWLVISFSTKTSIDAANPAKFASFIPNNNGGAEVNYAIAMKNLDFWNSIVTTIILTLVSNVLILVFSSMAAWQLVRSQKWWSKIIFYSFVVAMILPFQAIMIPMLSQFRRTNLADTMVGTIIAYMGFGMALSIFMLHGFLKTIPTALEESAAISGMNPFQIFFKVVLPLLKTTFITILVLNIMWIWNDYLLPSLLLSDSYGRQTLYVKLIQGLVSAIAADVKALSAGVVVLVIPPIVYFAFAQKKMIAGITHGSIK